MEFLSIGLTAIALVVAAAAVIFALKARTGTTQQDLAAVGQMAGKLADHQALLAGRLTQLAESQTAAQAMLAEQLQSQERAVTKMLDQRLMEMSRRVGLDLEKQTAKSAEAIGLLQERLAVIDAAQRNLTELSAEVVSLQDILSNKQARGAIGQTQMEDLVRNMLPPGAFDFQYTLGNGKRADCVIRLPNPPGLIAVDSKYPHEAFMALMAARDDRERQLAESQFKADVGKHIKDIAEKYIVPGETADSAIMFVPAESVFAELHDRFPGVVEEGFKRRVYIVSPTTLMATLNTVRAILKDSKMREQASILQKEIGKVMEDVGRLDLRVGALAKHFEQARADVEQIQISTRKITDRGAAIENLQLDSDAKEPTLRLISETRAS